jgi:hypothetical protein
LSFGGRPSLDATLLVPRLLPPGVSAFHELPVTVPKLRRGALSSCRLARLEDYGAAIAVL